VDALDELDRISSELAAAATRGDRQEVERLLAVQAWLRRRWDEACEEGNDHGPGTAAQ
jgi:hypothetical protein